MRLAGGTGRVKGPEWWFAQQRGTKERKGFHAKNAMRERHSAKQFISHIAAPNAVMDFSSGCAAITDLFASFAFFA